MIKQYEVLVQQKCDRGTDRYCSLGRLMKSIKKPYYNSLDDALHDLKIFVERHNKGARVEQSVVGGIGIDFVIDKETADSLAVVDWKIRVREVTPFEWVTDLEVL